MWLPQKQPDAHMVHTNRSNEDRESGERERDRAKKELLFTQEKKNYAKREVTAVHEGNRKHSRLTIPLFFFFFHSRSLALLTLDHSLDVS